MYLKKSFLILFFVLVLLTPLEIFAEEPSTSTDPGRIKSGLKETIAKTREDFKMMLEERRKEASESFKQKREEFKQKLQTLRDEKKKMLVERINNKLEEVNKRRTDHMMAVLDKLESLLDRLSQKVEEAKSAGKDTSGVELAIEAAQTKIDEARAAVITQAGEEYILEIGEESELRSRVGQTVSEFQEDLRDVHKLVVDAKQAVMNAVKEAAKIKMSKLSFNTDTVRLIFNLNFKN